MDEVPVLFPVSREFGLPETGLGGLRPPPRNYLISHLRIAVIHPIGEAPQNAPQGQQVDRPEGDSPGRYPPERVRRLNVGKRSPMVGSVPSGAR